ncbi:hypothetical protein TNCV_2909741 [Trichonephila clavipes]|nr:hypothetical protein TNCV_2909741 [Trichonephila clavipes]
MFSVWLCRIVQLLRQKFELQLVPQCSNELLEIGYFKAICSMYSTDSKPLLFLTLTVSSQSSLEGRWSGDLLCFVMKAGSVLVSVMAMCWSDGGQGNTCNQTVRDLDTLDLYLDSWSGELL